MVAVEQKNKYTMKQTNKEATKKRICFQRLRHRPLGISKEKQYL